MVFRPDLGMRPSLSRHHFSANGLFLEKPDSDGRAFAFRRRRTALTSTTGQPWPVSAASSKRLADADFPHESRLLPKTDRRAYQRPAPTAWRRVIIPRVFRVEGDDLPAIDRDTNRLASCHRVARTRLLSGVQSGVKKNLAKSAHHRCALVISRSNAPVD